MVTQSLYRLLDLSNSKKQKIPGLISKGKYFPLLINAGKSFPFSYVYLFFKLVLVNKKKGTQKRRPPRCQSNSNTLVALTLSTQGVDHG